MRSGIFRDTSFLTKMWIVLTVVFVGFGLTVIIYGIVTFGYAPEALRDEAESDIFLLRLLQVLQSFFVFIFPTLLLAVLFSSQPARYLYFEKEKNGLVLFLVILAGITLIPFINWLAYWNEQITFPEALKGIENWMQRNEEANAKVMEKMLRMNSVGILLFNILLIGILAGVGEEFLFRGIIQRVVLQGTRNIHLAIWITAFIFSAIHMQFYGFFPRLLLGAYFGYLLWWTKSIRIPVLAHFVNNTIAVLAVYLEQHKYTDTGLDDIGSKGEIEVVGISVVLSAIFIFLIYKKRSKQEKV